MVINILQIMHESKFLFKNICLISSIGFFRKKCSSRTVETKSVYKELEKTITLIGKNFIVLTKRIYFHYNKIFTI